MLGRDSIRGGSVGVQRGETLPQRHHGESARGATRVVPGDRGVSGVAGVVATDFGANAVHGGPDSRSLPNAQEVDEVGRVFAWVMKTRHEDVYTNPGSKARIAEFFARVGEDPPASVIAGA